MVNLLSLLITALPLASAAAFPPIRRRSPTTDHSLSKRSFSGPQMPENFPDPSIIKVNDKWWAFATTGNGHHVQVASSSDFNSGWTLAGDTDPLNFDSGVPSWIDSGNKAIWAPDVFQLNDGSFAMTYSARVAEKGGHCVGVSISHAANPDSGFNEHKPEAFVCPDETGAIDSSYFRDSDGGLYLLYKIDGNCCGKPTPIFVQQVEQDGWTKIGDPVEILRDGPYDGGITEAPHMVFRDGMWIVFFSSNWYNTDYYDISYATSTAGVRGPFEKSTKPLLVTGGELGGPGGAAVVNDGDSVRIAFHANKGGPGHAGDSRLLWTGELAVHGDSRTVTI